MSVVDNRVVKMAFDNKDFENNVGTTLSTLDKLKAALKFDGAIDGLKNLGNAAKNVSFDAIETGVYSVQNGFNALDIVATRVLQNITDMAFNTGKQLISALTIEPIKSGYDEYKTQIDSIQTILANTSDALKEQGLTTEHDRIEKINAVLDDLNHYADMTIYNFTEMTRNIGTFTAAGVELDTAANSIKGIANLAAMAGSNSEQASRAMYQLSQAIANGAVKLQDWNSVVNAGMGGKLFQDELLGTAFDMETYDTPKKHKDAYSAVISGDKSFRESLEAGWLTSEVLTTTLEKFTAGSEGYTKSQVEQMRQLWEARGYTKTMIDELTGSLTILTDEQERNLRLKWKERGFGPEQQEHILELGAAATDAATKVKTFTQLIDTLKEALQSGWTQTWEYIIGDFEQAKRLWTEVSDILNMYIGKSADARNEILEVWSRATYAYNEAGELIYASDGKLVEGGKMLAEEMGGREAVIQGIRNIFQGLIEIGVQFRNAWDWYFLGKDTKDVENPFDKLYMTGEKLIEMSKRFLEFTDNFKKALGTADEPTQLLLDLQKIFISFSTSMRDVYRGVRDVFSGLGNIFGSFFNSSFFSIDTLRSFVDAFGEIAVRVREFGLAINQNFGNDAGGQNREGLIKFFNGLKDIIEATTWVKLDFILNAFDGFGKVIEHIIGPGETISTILGDLGEKLSKVAAGINNFFNDENGISKFKELFSDLADNFNSFFDTLSKVVDFEGITGFFNQLVSILNGGFGDKFTIIEDVFQGLLNIFEALLGVLGPIADAFTDVFGPWLAQAVSYIGELASRFKDFTATLVPSEELMTGIQKLFVGIFTVIQALASLLIDTFLSAWDNLSEIFSEILPTGENLGKILGGIGDNLKEFGNALKDIVGGKSDLPSFADGLDLVTDKIVAFIKAVKNSDILKNIGGWFAEFFAKIKEGLFGIEGKAGILSKIGESLKKFFSDIKIALIGEDGLDFGDIVTNGGIIFAIKKFVEFIKDAFGENKGLFDTIKETISDVGEAICDTFEAIQDRLKFDALEKIAKSILMIAGALFVIALIDTDELIQSLVAIGTIMKAIDLLMNSINKMGDIDTKGMAAVATAMISLGTALLLIAAACKLLSTMNLEEFVTGLTSTIILINVLTKAAEDLSKDNERMMKGATGLIALALAVDLLVISVKALGSMDLIELASGLLATIVLINALVEATSKIDKDFSFGDAAGLLILAMAMKELAKAVTKFAQLNLGELVIGLTGFAASLTMVLIALEVLSETNSGDNLIKTAAAMLILAQAMKAVASAISTIGSLSFSELATGLIGFAAGLAAMTIAVIELEKFGSAEAAIGLAALSASMLLLAEALRIVGGLDFFGQIVPGLIGLGGALAIFVVAANFITPAMAASMIAVAGAIALLGVGVLAFSAGLAALGVAVSTSGTALLWFLSQLIVFLPQAATALANAIATFITTLADNATSILESFKTLGMTVLEALKALVPELLETIGLMLESIATLIIEKAPVFFKALEVIAEKLWGFLNSQLSKLFEFLRNLIEEFSGFLQDEGPTLIETIRLLLDTILQAIIEEAPVIGEAFLTLLQTILKVVQTSIPEISETLLTLITSLLKQLAEFIPQMAQAAMDLILGFLKAVGENIDKITEAAINVALAFIKGITEKMPEIVDSAFKLLIGFIDGLATAIEENHDKLFDAIGHLIKAIVEAIVDGIEKIVEAIGKWFTGEDGTGGILGAIDGFFKDIYDAGANLVQGFIDGLASAPGKIWDAACDLASKAWEAITTTLDEHSPSRLTYGGGQNFVLGFINAINDYIPEAVSVSAAMAYGVLDSFNDAIDDGTHSYMPMISPVIDDSNIKSSIGKYLGDVNNTITGTASISGTLKADADMKAQLEAALSKPADYSEILKEMSILDRNLANYNETLSRMQVVMDTGSLVGALTPTIDQALGRNAILAGRGI